MHDDASPHARASRTPLVPERLRSPLFTQAQKLAMTLVTLGALAAGCEGGDTIVHIETSDGSGPVAMRHPYAAPNPVGRMGIPGRYLSAYKAAADSVKPRCDMPWQLLAAVGLRESTHGKDMGPSSAGAIGPMQFLPDTWKDWGKGGDVWKPEDATRGAARMLCHYGHNDLNKSGNVERALRSYNDSRTYVASVRSAERRYFGGRAPSAGARRRVVVGREDGGPGGAPSASIDGTEVRAEGPATLSKSPVAGVRPVRRTGGPGPSFGSM